MNARLRALPLEERLRLVEDLWDSIAADKQTLPLTEEQKTELDHRLDAYEADRDLTAAALWAARGRRVYRDAAELHRSLDELGVLP